MSFDPPRFGDISELLYPGGEAPFSRRLVQSGSQGTGSAGDVRETYFDCRRTESVSQMYVRSGATAAVGATLVKFGLYEEDFATRNLALSAVTANDTTLFAATNTDYTRSFVSPVVKQEGKRYVGTFVIVGATTMPTIVGMTSMLTSVIALRGARVAAARSGQTDMPSSITAFGGSSVSHYFELLP